MPPVGDEDVIGRNHADVIDGGEGDNGPRGGAGDDTILGQGGNDDLDGAPSPTSEMPA